MTRDLRRRMFIFEDSVRNHFFAGIIPTAIFYGYYDGVFINHFYKSKYSGAAEHFTVKAESDYSAKIALKNGTLVYNLYLINKW